MKKLILLLFLAAALHSFGQISIADVTVTTTGTQLNYINAATGVTGTGNIVLGTSPTLITPVLGVATATSINKVVITAPATSATLTVADGTTLATKVSYTIDGIGQTTLVSGTKAITITGITTSSIGIITLVSQGGTVTTTTAYKGVCTSNTLTITAMTSAKATNTSDTSIINYEVIN